MGWIKDFFTYIANEDTNKIEKVKANVKVDNNGHVSDFTHHRERDTSKHRDNHGHTWGLNRDKDTGGRKERNRK